MSLTQRLRKYYDEAHDIPSITAPQPQLQFSLLQQKLEMLQYCIRQKQNREERSQGMDQCGFTCNLHFTAKVKVNCCVK